MVVPRLVSKVLRSRLLMPMSWRVEHERAIELGLIMDLDQHVHAEIAGGSRQILRRRIVDRGHDDEDAVGAPGPRLQHLIGVEHKVLAQSRQPGGRAGLSQKFGPALEGGGIGQHRKAGGAARFISLRQGGRIEIGADQAFGGARLLDLGDEREFAPRHTSAERFGEWPHRGRCLGAGAQGGSGKASLGGFHLPPLIGDDLVEHLCHGLKTYHG